jgi:hypothetical protein
MKKQIKKTITKKSVVENSEEPQNEKSEEFKRFEEGLKAIFSLSPEQAKRIREEKPLPDPDQKKIN